ncbi:metallophosphoesterase [Bradyrhizobium sp. WSM471]|uniref:metallophosphoesterase n=1 Tax=Bradyrhizobium sp. WSM471 TaxID=319017 RepID=UPI00031C6460|nr:MULTISPECIES: metallophosphoesterase [Bradyrhizobium]UFW42385.1 metallophosphoesterase [Bradyrhizobium canariense]
MRLQIVNDLHLDHPGSGGAPPLAKGVRMVVVAGDTCEGLVNAVEQLRRAYPAPTEVVMVAGNHELWSKNLDFEEHWEEGLLAAERHGVHLLENSALTLWGVRLLGCTLWTDYELFGAHMRDVAMHAAAHTMLDHRRIKWRRDPWRRFRPAEARLLHHRSRLFLETELAKSHDGPTVCISHHAMTPEAVAPAFRDSMVTAAYASELSSLIDRFQPDLIVSGHTHYPMDLTRGRTRLLSNPAGYPGESRSFDPAFVVELPDP